ncbi:hypothetical protein J6590_016448 [Homalodisca vitripennis]|nr:hypothetical protein J6590_016448 [Homalodisca vitripennis]
MKGQTREKRARLEKRRLGNIRIGQEQCNLSAFQELQIRTVTSLYILEAVTLAVDRNHQRLGDVTNTALGTTQSLPCQFTTRISTRSNRATQAVQLLPERLKRIRKDKTFNNHLMEWLLEHTFYTLEGFFNWRNNQITSADFLGEFLRDGRTTSDGAEFAPRVWYRATLQEQKSKVTTTGSHSSRENLYSSRQQLQQPGVEHDNVRPITLAHTPLYLQCDKRTTTQYKIERYYCQLNSDNIDR